MNIYVERSHRKVYFVCESGCTKAKCICGWTTAKTIEVLYLENKVEMKAWYVRLLHRQVVSDSIWRIYLICYIQR